MKKKNIRRRRALRAAQAVTLGLAMVGAGGCSDSHETGEDTGTDTMMADAGEDTNAPDTNVDCSTDEFPPSTEACCDEFGGFWVDDRCEVAVPGPFVPPRMA